MAEDEPEDGAETAQVPPRRQGATLDVDLWWAGMALAAGLMAAEAHSQRRGVVMLGATLLAGLSAQRAVSINRHPQEGAAPSDGR